jgi:hypothetical protein
LSVVTCCTTSGAFSGYDWVATICFAAEQLVAVLVPLVENGDLRLRMLLRDQAPVDRALARIARQERDRPGPARVLVRERACAAADEELRHLLLVQVLPDRERVLGADGVEDREDVVLLDELRRQLRGLRGVVLVVLDLVDDLPPVDAAVRVDVVEVRLRTAQHRLVLRFRARERPGAAEDDLIRRHAGRRFSSGVRSGDREGKRDEDGEDARHRETAFFSTERLSVTRPIVSFESGCTDAR